MKNLSKSYISAIVIFVGSALISSCSKPANDDTQIPPSALAASTTDKAAAAYL